MATGVAGAIEVDGGTLAWSCPVCDSRALMWTSAGLVFLSVLIATFVTLPAARR